MNTLSFDLDKRHFDTISQTVYQIAGITLPRGKEGLVQARLSKRIRALDLDGFEDYLARVRNDRSGAESAIMVDLLTTNKTSFFRESQHFDFLSQHVFPALHTARAPVRIWSAGCSSGEEPYTLAMLLREEFGTGERGDMRILATDISARVLERAKKGVYAPNLLDGIPPALLHRYFNRTPEGEHSASGELRSLIRFARLNLMESWPMRGPFDAILCRNVMIYFDPPTRERLVQRFHALLAPGGHLFVGHSETLSSLSHSFRYVEPAVYVK